MEHSFDPLSYSCYLEAIVCGYVPCTDEMKTESKFIAMQFPTEIKLVDKSITTEEFMDHGVSNSLVTSTKPDLNQLIKNHTQIGSDEKELLIVSIFVCLLLLSLYDHDDNGWNMF